MALILRVKSHKVSKASGPKTPDVSIEEMCLCNGLIFGLLPFC